MVLLKKYLMQIRRIFKVIIPKGFEHDCLNSFGTIGKDGFVKNELE